DIRLLRSRHWVIRVDIAMSAVLSALTTPENTTSDRDPSACRLPAFDLQTPGTAPCALLPLCGRRRRELHGDDRGEVRDRVPSKCLPVGPKARKPVVNGPL